LASWKGIEPLSSGGGCRTRTDLRIRSDISGSTILVFVIDQLANTRRASARNARLRETHGRLCPPRARLAHDHIETIIADALRCETKRAASLARLAYDKTAGNPFFVIQFLHALAQKAPNAISASERPGDTGGTSRWTERFLDCVRYRRSQGDSSDVPVALAFDGLIGA
jgi:hypothetical protein